MTNSEVQINLRGVGRPPEEWVKFERLGDRLDSNKLTRTYIGKKLGVSGQTVANWIRRGAVPKQYYNQLKQIIRKRPCVVRKTQVNSN